VAHRLSPLISRNFQGLREPSRVGENVTLLLSDDKDDDTDGIKDSWVVKDGTARCNVALAPAGKSRRSRDDRGNSSFTVVVELSDEIMQLWKA
jgi:hypothetical protein